MNAYGMPPFSRIQRDGDGGVEPAREGDPDALADGQRLEDPAHRRSVPVGRNPARQAEACHRRLRWRPSAPRPSSSAGLKAPSSRVRIDACPVDDERERLALQVPLVDPPVRPLRRVVVLVDLDVDEVDALALPLPGDRLDDLDDRAAGARLAVERRREGDDERAASRPSRRRPSSGAGSGRAARRS